MLFRSARGEADAGQLLGALGLGPERAAERFVCRGPHGEPVPGSLEEALRDATGEKLARQNGNPVKVLTSGPERRVAVPFHAGGKVRHEGRVPWWDRYADEAWCVFGHYWRRRLAGDADEDHLFDDSRPYAPLGNGRALCIDYSAGKRWRERARGGAGPFQTWLAALRWPERLLFFDQGRPVALA